MAQAAAEVSLKDEGANRQVRIVLAKRVPAPEEDEPRPGRKGKAAGASLSGGLPSL